MLGVFTQKGRFDKSRAQHFDEGEDVLLHEDGHLLQLTVRQGLAVHLLHLFHDCTLA